MEKAQVGTWGVEEAVMVLFLEGAVEAKAKETEVAGAVGRQVERQGLEEAVEVSMEAACSREHSSTSRTAHSRDSAAFEQLLPKARFLIAVGKCSLQSRSPGLVDSRRLRSAHIRTSQSKESGDSKIVIPGTLQWIGNARKSVPRRHPCFRTSCRR